MGVDADPLREWWKWPHPADMRKFLAEANHEGPATTWRGVTILKHPTDLWMLAEAIHATSPDLIIETGTYQGGSALFMAEVSDAWVVTIDTTKPARAPFPSDSRVMFYLGSSTDLETREALHDDLGGARVMVVLDAAHDAPHVAAELELYAPLVSPGCYLIVEDTAAGLYMPGWDEGGGPPMGHGPWAALEPWLACHPEFTIDRTKHRFGATMHPRGWLIRQG